MIRSKLPVPVDEDDDDTGAPQISLAEMLDDLDIGEDATGDPGDFMAELYIFFHYHLMVLSYRGWSVCWT